MNGKPTILFYLVAALIVLGLVAFAAYRFLWSEKPGGQMDTVSNAQGNQSTKDGGFASVDQAALAKIVPAREIPTLEPAGEYKPQGNIIDVELSDWPGYAPILVANGGLEPSDDSYFARKHGFKLRIKLSEGESESWSALNSGKMAASSTTVDVLALYGSQLKVEVPVQLDFSRGGDGILTLKEITSINQLKGLTVVVAQQTEADFFLRFLAQEAGLELKPLKGWDDSRDPAKVNLLYTETAEDAAEVFKAFLAAKSKELAGCVTWNPFIHEVPKEYPDQVRLLTTNRNLLIIADVLIVNQGFAKANPKIVQGMVDGIMWATQELRKNPEPYLPLVAKAFEQTVDELRESLKDVHLSNLPENLLFFSDKPGQIGTFSEIYYSAVYCYGRDIIRNPVPPERLVNRRYLEELEKSGAYAGQVVELGPSEERDKKTILESNPLLTKQIRFLFEPNSTNLDLNDPSNQRALKDLLQLLKLTPGSYLVLRGHLDNSQVAEFKRQGEAFYRKQAVRAVEMSKARAEAVKAVLVRNGVDPMRIDTDGRGWDEPIPGASPDENRRVEVQLYTLE